MASDGVAKKQRLVLLDLLRIVFALLVYARHSYTMFNCNYGLVLNYRIYSSTRPIMIGFFVLSGFSLFYSNSDKTIQTASELKQFWIKRLIAIIPSYFLMHFLWIIFNRGQFKDWLIMSPMEFTGSQSAYNSFFGILHNGGTWFVSCILFCYFLYPMIHTIISKCSSKKLIAVSFFLLSFTYYSDFLVDRYKLVNNYPNPFFRMIEFTLGAIICVLMLRIPEKDAWKYSSVIAVVLIIAAAIMHFAFHWSFAYIVLKLAIPGFAVLLLISRNIKLKGNLVISTLSAMSYHFFLVQLILWDVSAKVLNLLGLSGNAAKITVSLTCCTVISFLMYMCFDKPIKKLATKTLLKKKTRNEPVTNT